MGTSISKEQSMITAIESQDPGALRAAIKDLTTDEIRNLCKSVVPFQEHQYSILHYATWQGVPDLLAPLLDYVEDFEIRDELGWTPLMTAINRGCSQNASMLISHGAKVDCDWIGGMSLLADAMSYGDTELITLLLNHGARAAPTAEMLSNEEAKDQVHYLLHYAVDDNCLDIAKLLIEKAKIPLNTLDHSGWSPLHLAAGHNNMEMLKLLIEKGADINIKDSEGNTPLAWARELKATETMHELQRYGATADKDWHGELPELKTPEERYEAALTAGEYDGYDEAAQTEGASNGTGYDRFEIEVENSKTKGQKPASNGVDALQRQRASANSTF